MEWNYNLIILKA